MRRRPARLAKRAARAAESSSSSGAAPSAYRPARLCVEAQLVGAAVEWPPTRRPLPSKSASSVAAQNTGATGMPGHVAKRVGERARADRLDERHQRTAEQARLLPRRDDDALPVRALRSSRCRRGATRRRIAGASSSSQLEPTLAGDVARVGPPPVERRAAADEYHCGSAPGARRDATAAIRQAIRCERSASIHACGLRPTSFVVRLAADDRPRAIQLLGEHEPRQLVRQRPRRERERATTRAA